MRTPIDSFTIRSLPDRSCTFVVEDADDCRELFRVSFPPLAGCTGLLVNPELMIKRIGELMIKSHREGVIEGRCELQRELRRLIGAREC